MRFYRCSIVKHEARQERFLLASSSVTSEMKALRDTIVS